MRKGEEKRQVLLNAAEKLFCERGYEAASVQDILDAEHISKGGFYHHFASKEEVLKALCDRRAVRAAEDAQNALKAADTPVARINALLYAFMPLRRGEADFVRLLLPGIDKPEGRAIAMTYQDALKETFLPLLEAEVAAAAAAGVVYPPAKGMEAVILHTVNHCWMEIAAALASAPQGSRVETTSLLHLLEKYRRAVEVLLDAPYGSVEILRVEEWDEVLGAIQR
ncbi:MAG: TetR/AcrR family transcriptional regulator [Clostridia bacterium]|nr:TetR/AcrR family transcriptional regulator [Clostridia bacterium]